MKPTTVLHLALAGTRTDLLRVLLTAFSALLATIAILAALTVLAIPTPAPIAENHTPFSEQYTNALLREPGLRPGLAFALVLLTIPVLALAGQSARLGAPARDRRLAAFRMAGATPGQGTLIAATEATVASLLGTAIGLGTYLLGRQLLHRPDADGRLVLPTDVLPPAWALVAVVLGLPLLTGMTTMIMLRGVMLTPFGVVRRNRRHGAPGWWPGVLIVLGVAAVASVTPLSRWYARNGQEMSAGLVLSLLLGGGLLATVGVVLGTGWISYTAGRVLHRFARRPAALLAARRLMADPWHGSRTFAALLAAVIFGAGAASVRAWFVVQDAVYAEDQRRVDELVGQVSQPSGSWGDFYLATMDLVRTAVLVALVIAAGGLLIALAEGIVARRRTHAALVAGGVPRPVLTRSVAWQSLAPAVPAVLLAVIVGAALGRGLLGGEASSGTTGISYCDADPVTCANPETAQQYSRSMEFEAVVRPIPVPFDDLAWYGLSALALVLVTVGIGALVLRSSVTVEELRVG